MIDINDIGRVFVIRPFNKKENKKGEKLDYDEVHKKLIEPAFATLGLSGGTTIEFKHQGAIHEDMYREIITADLVIADLSIHNANAFYELGIRHALRDKYTVIIRADSCTDATVFDLHSERYMEYSAQNPADSISLLIEKIEATLKNTSGDSPVFRLLPGLPPLKPSKVASAPRGFLNKVELAADLNSPSKLIELKEIAIKKHWERQGLRAIAKVQSAKGYHEHAAFTWEQIRKYDPKDIEANQKLATHYQKLSKYIESGQAADLALDNDEITDWEKAETHALIASNHKAQWKELFSDLPDTTDRQKRALTSDLLDKASSAYQEAFEHHRNHYYSGLNAVSMLSIQLKLATIFPEDWEYLFDTERKANDELQNREELLLKLVVATELAITSSIKNYDDNWARISQADLKLLTSSNTLRVGTSYSRCIEIIKDFPYESMRSQLELYQALGLFEENVQHVLGMLPSDK